MQTSVWEINVPSSLPISLQSSLHLTEFKNREIAKITWGTAFSSSSFPQSFDWLASLQLELPQDILFTVVCLSAPVLLQLGLSILGEVFLRIFFTDIAPSRTFTTNSSCIIICLIRKGCQFYFKICKLHGLIQISMKLASIDSNIWLCKMQYLLVYILDIVLLFVYIVPHYVTQSDTEAKRVWNCDLNTSAWETGGFTVGSVSLKSLFIVKILKLSFLKRSVFWIYARINFRRIAFTTNYIIPILPIFIVKY